MVPIYLCDDDPNIRRLIREKLEQEILICGYDMEVLPPDIVTYGNEAKSLLEDLQSRNERMFLVTVLVMNTAKSKSKALSMSRMRASCSGK